MSTMDRRHFIKVVAATSAAAATGLYQTQAHAAEFTLKFANNLPVSHPMNIRAKEMAQKIAEQSKGRIDFQIYPNNQLGSDSGIEIGTPKPGSALERTVLVEHDAGSNESDPGQIVGETRR